MVSSISGNHLPPEILIQIFSHNPHKDINNASLACKGFYKIIHDSSLWRSRFYNYWPLATHVGYSSLEDTWKNRFVQLYQLESNPWVCPLETKEEEYVTYYYKDKEVIFQQVFDVQTNYKTTILTTNGNFYQLHYPEQINFIKVGKNQIVCNYAHGLICFYAINKNKINFSQSPRSIDTGSSCHYFDCSDTTLICGGNSISAKAYTINSGQLIHEIANINSQVSALKLLDSFSAVIGYENGQLLLWDLKQKITISLSTHTEKILFIEATETVVVSVDANQTICMYDLIKSQQVTLFDAHDSPITKCLLQNNLLISADSQGLIKIWDVKQKKCLHTLKAHTHTVSSLASFQTVLLASGSHTGEIKLWNLLTGKCLSTFQTTRSKIDYLYLDQQQIICRFQNNKTLKIMLFFKPLPKSLPQPTFILSWLNPLSYFSSLPIFT